MSPTAPPPGTVSASIDARYGRTESGRRRGRLLAIVAAVGVAVTVVAWVIWAGLLSPAATIETRNLGFDDVTDRSITVLAEVTTQPGTSVQCALEALGEDHSIVGWKVVALPPADVHVRQFSETLRTTETAVTGLISRCWLT